MQNGDIDRVAEANIIKLIGALVTKFEEMEEAKRTLRSFMGKIEGSVKGDIFFDSEALDRTSTILRDLFEKNSLLKREYEELLKRPMPKRVSEAKRELLKYTREQESKISRKYAEEFLELSDPTGKMQGILEKKQNALRSIMKKSDEKALSPYINFMVGIEETDPIMQVEYIQKLAPYFERELIAYAILEKKLKNNARGKVAVDENKSQKEAATKKEPDIKTTVESAAEAIENIEEEDDSDFDSKEIEKVVKDAEYEYPVDEDYGQFTQKISPKESKEFKFAKFKKEDLNGAFGLEVSEVLRLVSHLSCVSVGMTSGIVEMSEELAKKVMETMFNKGYLRKYVFYGIGEFYVGSPVFEKILRSPKLSDNLSISKRALKPRAMFLDMPAIYAGTCLALTRLVGIFEESKQTSVDKAMLPLITKDKIRLKLFSDFFFTKSTDVLNYSYSLIGCFCADDKGVSLFLDEFLDFVEDIKTSDLVVIAGINKKQAFAACKMIVSIIGDDWRNKSKLHFYSLMENEFYIGNKKKVSVSRIIEKTFLEASKVRENKKKPEPKTSDDNIIDVVVSEPEKTEEKEKKNNVVQIKELARESETIVKTAPQSEIAKKDLSLNNQKKIENTGESKPKAEMEKKPEEIAKESVKPEEPSAKTSIVETAGNMILSGKIYAACAYLKVCGGDTYLRLAYAVNDPLESPSYISDKVYDLFMVRETVFDEYLMIASSLRVFFFDRDTYDHGIPMLYDALKQCSVMEDLPSLANFAYELMNFKKEVHKGVDCFADYREKNRLQTEKVMAAVRQEAQSIYTSIFENPVKEQARLKRFLETKKILFSKSGDFALYLQAAINNDDAYLQIVEEYLVKNFIKDKSPIDTANIDQDKIDKIIDEAWNDASKNLMVVKKNKDLIGSLRSNMRNTIFKIIGVLCQWTKYANLLQGESDDGGRIRYKKIRKDLLNFTETILDALTDKKQTSKATLEKAGVYILARTVGEIDERILGTYFAERNKYFYINFLKDSNVYLTENYLPDFDICFDKDMSIAKNIEAHVGEKKPMSLDERVRFNFEGGGDDFLSAALIDEYLKEKNGKSVIAENRYDAEKSIEYAKKDAKKTMDDFVENLELAQSYGQIDNSEENKKEKILQIVTHWYEYALETKNFSVFKRAKNYWEERISRDAKAREEFFRHEINSFSKKAESDPKLKERLKRIEDVIKSQNYTVAEDMLGRLNRNEPEEDAVFFEKDILKDFLDNYEFYYSKVSKVGDSLANLIKRGNRTNKDSKGGGRLAENWVSGYGANNGAKLEILFKTLGFAVDKVNKNSAENNVENYSISIKKPLNGQNSNYKHPIAIFGSIAEEIGFRVICLFGKYEADGLIERFKQVGDSKHTIAVLDYALTMGERRRLARKIRAEHLDKTYGVIDRVLLVYLIEHYNEMRITRMLMELMMPFAAYQPYVWKSSDVMPPEIFMGRKEELSLIESAKGVNIVYGGRQLGKSAMLKMAKNNVDRNENGDRAVYIDIKDRNYKETALKISQVLSDDGFFEENAETDDWDALSRLIKKRLNSSKNPVPYFLLLLDEADAFISSCAEVNYRPLDALKDVQSIGVGRFKFVVAGLRDIIRFNKEALDNNNVLPHLSAMTVKPFKTTEARSLLEIPLWYLGLRFPKDKESLITLILANTNYFPGLIQLYCAKLIEAMGKSDYAGYNQSETPIYEVREEHIKKVLADETFTDEIKEKFIITLKLGDDQYYYIIALIFAFLYHANSDTDGYDAKDVIAVATDYDIKKISDLSLENVSALLEELRELNILRSAPQSKYLFSRHAFFQMLGSKNDIENELIKLMGE